MLSNHFDAQDEWGETIVGASLGADCILVMKRCEKGAPRCPE